MAFCRTAAVAADHVTCMGFAFVLKASQEQCRSLFDEATIKGEFGLPWAMRLQTRQFHASGSRVGGRSRSVHTPRSSTKFGRTGHRGGRSKSIKQAEEATAARSATQSPHSRVGAGMDDSASAPTTGQSDTGDLSIGIYVSTTSAAGKSAGPANWSHSNSETTKKLEIGVSATVIPSWLIEKYALQPVYEFPEEACDLLRKLLQRDPTQRLGGVNFPSRTHLHSHPFFETLDWVCICDCTCTSVWWLVLCCVHPLHFLLHSSLSPCCGN